MKKILSKVTRVTEQEYVVRLFYFYHHMIEILIQNEHFVKKMYFFNVILILFQMLFLETMAKKNSTSSNDGIDGEVVGSGFARSKKQLPNKTK